MSNEPTFHILAISGSLRTGSSNTTVLEAMAALVPPGVAVFTALDLTVLPYFNPDLDQPDVLPASVRDFRTQIGAADGLLLCSPEYAHGVPGVLKNALDWLVGSVEFPGKPVGLLNISPRSTYVQAALREILTTMSASLIASPALTISLPKTRFSLADLLADSQLVESLRLALDEFVQALHERRLRSAATPNAEPG